MIFLSKKVKTTKDIIIRKFLPLAYLLLPPQYDLYQRKSKKLVITSQSASIAAIFYGMSVSKPVPTSNIKLGSSQVKKLKLIRIY